MMDWGNYGWGMGFGWFFMILFGGLVAAGIVYVMKVVTERSARNERESALDILKRRYARGDITKEEYERIKKELR